MSPPLKARLALESLDRRDLMSAYTWTGAVSTDAADIQNWATTAPPSPPMPGMPPGTMTPPLPGQNDELFFNSASNSRNCVNLVSANGSFVAMHIQAGYNGTVFLGSVISVGTFDLASGAISQPGIIATLNVNGLFTWTGGVLNSSGVASTVNINGGGTIAPLSAGTVSLGSTLNLYGTDAQPTTLNVNPGTISLAASSGGINVNANANMLVGGFMPSSGTTVTLNGVTQTAQAITIAVKGSVTVVGSGVATDNSTCSANVPVINSGTFSLSGQVTANLQGGNANPLVYDYTQTGSASALVIQNESKLATSVGLYVNGGTVLLKTNPDSGVLQDATITGNLTFEGGTIQFDPPILVGTAMVYGTLTTPGNVFWGGGTYNPWVNYNPVANGGASVNYNVWTIGSTLTIPNLNADFVTPAVQNMPANGKPPANTFWNILVVKTVSNNNGAYLPTVNPDVKGNQLTLKSKVVNGWTGWSLNS